MAGPLNQVALKNNFGEATTNQIIAGAHGLVMTFPGGGALYSHAGAPSFSAAAGSLYMRTDGAAGTCLYINPTVGNNWVPIVSA